MSIFCSVVEIEERLLKLLTMKRLLRECVNVVRIGSVRIARRSVYSLRRFQNVSLFCMNSIVSLHSRIQPGAKMAQLRSCSLIFSSARLVAKPPLPF